MTTLHILTAIWLVATAAFAGLIIYRSHLTRHETNQVFLTESGLEQAHEELLVRRMDRLRPLLQTATGAFALLSLLVVGTYVAQLLPNVRL